MSKIEDGGVSLTPYQHLQRADALLHEADQADPHVVAAHRFVHEAAAHLSENPEVREQVINLNPTTVQTDDEAQQWKWRLHWHAPGDWFEVTTVEQLKLLLGASIYQLRRVGSDEVYNCTGTSTYYSAPTPTPPQGGMSTVEDLSDHAACRCRDVLGEAIARVADPKQRFEIALQTLCGLLGTTAGLLAIAEGRKPGEALPQDLVEDYKVVIGMVALTVSTVERTFRH